MQASTTTERLLLLIHLNKQIKKEYCINMKVEAKRTVIEVIHREEENGSNNLEKG